MKKIISLILCLAMCLALFCACGSEQATDAAQPEAAATTTAATEEKASDAGKEAAVMESADGEVVYNMTVTFEESWWDPAYFTQIQDTGLGPMIYENLVQLQTDGSVAPMLAESWEIANDVVYTFHLRQGVQWHKGYGEFTSADVKFSIERHADPDLGSIQAKNIGLDNIVSIECPDDYTVVITLKNADADFLTRLSLFYSMIVCKAHNDQDGRESLNTDPIGTGPFIFDGGTLGIKTEAVRNTEWWGDFEGGNIDRVVNTYINDTNTVNTALENGELDAISCYDYDKLNEFAEKGYTVRTTPYLQLVYLGMNMQLAPFDDPLVREAFFNAIDQDYFINDYFEGNQTPSTGYIPESSKYSASGIWSASYNPERSKELLAQAGYPNGCDITLWGSNDAAGEPLSIIAQYLLSQAGFNVELQSVDFGVFITQVREGTAQAWCLGNSTGAIADDTMYRYTTACYPGNNWCGVCDEEYDKLVTAALAATTEEEKASNYEAAQKRLMELQVLYPVCSYDMSSVYSPNISGQKTYGDLCFRATTLIKK